MLISQRPATPSLLIAAFFVTTALTTVASHAQTTTWIEGLGAGNTWYGSTNWDNGAPDINTDAILPTVGNGGPSFVIQDATVDGAARSVQLGSTLQVRQGGILDIAQGFLGTASASKLWVDDSNSTVTIGGVLTFDQGGEIRVTAGGTLATQGGAVLSGVAGSADRFEGDINGGTWTNTGDMTLGGAGNGYMIVRSNGTLTTGNLTLGEFAGGRGEIYIGSGGTVTSTNTADIGDAGYGEVRIGSNGTFKTQIGRIGNDVGGSGMVTVGGGIWTNGGTLTVGVKGEGTVLVQGGGTLETESLVLGSEASATGLVTVTGTGSTLNTEATAYVGQEGTGSLQVLDGAVATIGLTTSNDLVLGYNTDANGLVRVAGGGTLNGTGGLAVGAAGAGRVEIDGAGSTAFFDRMTVGSGIGSTGDVVLANGAGLAINTTAIVGYGGTASLDLSGGSTFTAGDLAVASSDPVSRGTVRLDNSTMAITGYLGLATYGTAEMVVTNGSTLSSYELYIAAGGGSHGNLTLANSTMTIANLVEIGGGGDGALTLTQGAEASIGNLVIGNTNDLGHGTLSIANGTLSVVGSLTQYANSTYSYVIGDGPTAGGVFYVDGSATIVDGTQLAVSFDGAVANGDTFVVLTAGLGVTGTYTLANGGQVTAFLGIDAIYDPATVTIVVTSSQDFIDVASTPNQIAAAAGLQSLGSGNGLFDTIMNIATEDEARFAFDQLSGEAHASLKTALIDDSRFLRNAANDRIRAAFGDETVAATPVLAYGPGGPELSAPDVDLLAVWGQGFGSWGKWDNDGNAAAFSRDTAGMLLGADAFLSDWRIGLMAGYSHDSMSLPDRSSSGSADNYHLGAYAGTEWGNVAFRSGLTYTWHDIDTSRRPAFTGFSENLTGSYGAGTAQAFGEFGYRFDIASRTMLEPFANLAFVSHGTDAFAETGGSAALSAAAQTINTTFTTLGLRASHSMTMGTVDVTARGMLGWRHAYGDTTPTSTHAFAGGDAFTVAGVPIGKDAALVEAGLDFTLTPTATLGITYAGQFASGTTDQAVKANLSVRF